MALRDDLIPVVDTVRRDVIDGAVGLRLHPVVVRRRSWTGSRLGVGTPLDRDTILDPVPRARPALMLRSAEPGKFEEGDVVVDRVSLTYTEDQLSGALSASEEMFWLVDGEAYRVVGVEERFLEWRVHLRRMRDRS